MDPFVGVVVFTIGIGLFVFPVPLSVPVADRVAGTTEHGATVAVRGIALVIVAVGVGIIFL